MQLLLRRVRQRFREEIINISQMSFSEGKTISSIVSNNAHVIRSLACTLHVKAHVIRSRGTTDNIAVYNHERVIPCEHSVSKIVMLLYKPQEKKGRCLQFSGAPFIVLNTRRLKNKMKIKLKKRKKSVGLLSISIHKVILNTPFFLTNSRNPITFSIYIHGTVNDLPTYVPIYDPFELTRACTFIDVKNNVAYVLKSNKMVHLFTFFVLYINHFGLLKLLSVFFYFCLLKYFKYQGKVDFFFTELCNSIADNGKHL